MLDYYLKNIVVKGCVWSILRVPTCLGPALGGDRRRLLIIWEQVVQPQHPFRSDGHFPFCYLQGRGGTGAAKGEREGRPSPDTRKDLVEQR